MGDLLSIQGSNFIQNGRTSSINFNGTPATLEIREKERFHTLCKGKCAFVIGDIAYVGSLATSSNQTSSREFWEFDP